MQTLSYRVELTKLSDGGTNIKIIEVYNGAEIALANNVGTFIDSEAQEAAWIHIAVAAEPRAED